MVRRLKEDIREIQGGFPKRNVKRIDIMGLPDDAPELALSRLLDEYRTAREERYASEASRIRYAAGLMVVGLQQRLLSSIEAFARTLKVHRKTVQRQWDRAHQDINGEEAVGPRDLDGFVRAPDADDERAELTGEEAEALEDAQVEEIDSASRPVAQEEFAAWEREQRLLDRMQEVAEDSRHLPDAKTRWLIDWVRRNQCPGLPEFGTRPAGQPPTWNDRRVLIFTENREGTKRYLKSTLEWAIAGTDRADERIAIIDGLTSPARRREVQRRFNADPALEPLRVLIATDAAREGLNLQAQCSDMFHFDLPEVCSLSLSADELGSVAEQIQEPWRVTPPPREFTVVDEAFQPPFRIPLIADPRWYDEPLEEPFRNEKMQRGVPGAVPTGVQSDDPWKIHWWVDVEDNHYRFPARAA